MDIKGACKFLKQYTLELIQKGQNDLLAPSFKNRNYALTSYTAEPRLTYTKEHCFVLLRRMNM